jgi:pimeloyl-ACP methyl ester carboxylesterase
VSPLIIYVHGAGATPKSFAYIQSQLPEHEAIGFAYNTNGPSEVAIMALGDLIRKQTQPVYLVAHSLGGLISFHAAFRAEVAGIVTIATPFGGSKPATLLRWIFDSVLLEELQPYSKLVRAVRERALPCPVTTIVTTAGALPFMREPNDGVVTVASQRAIAATEVVVLPTNHFECLMSQETLDVITQKVFE